MSRFTNLMVHVLAAVIALLIVIGALLLIAYAYDIYTPPEPRAASMLAITGATLISGTGDPPVPNATIVIGGDRILSIEAAGAIPKSAEVLDADGLFVAPALLDAAIYYEAPAGTEVNYLSGEWAWEITRSLPDHRRALLDAGITTILDLGSGAESILRTRSLLLSGELAGPRLYTAGPVLTAPGGFPGQAHYPWRRDETTVEIQTAEAGRQWVQTLAGRDVDLISISYTTLGTAFPRMEPEILLTIIQEAHAFGLPALVHTASLEEALAAAAAGADALVGGVTLLGEQVDGELLRLLAEQGTSYIPTLAAVEARRQENVGAESLAAAQLNLRLVHQAGIRVVAGSGTAGQWMEPGHSLHAELALMAAAGLAPAEVLRAATVNAAELLEVEDDLGTLEENKLADLILLDDNPQLSPDALARVRGVIQNGSVLFATISEP